MPSEEDLSRSNAAGCMEVFFHDSQQFDSSIMRWEDRYCPEPCGWADIPGPCYIEVSCVLVVFSSQIYHHLLQSHGAKT